jgi:hypothetical protein
MISAACEDVGVTDSGRPPGRAGLGMRDMIGAMVVLLVIVGVLVAVTRGCSFDPGAPSTDRRTAPSVDMSAKLAEAAATVTFPVRRPSVPAGWQANSSSTAQVGTGAAADVVVRVGWLTASSRYLQLSQSGGSFDDVLATESGEAGSPTGSVSVDSVTWQKHPSRRDEIAWATAMGGSVLVITGNASEAEFQELASAVVAARPLPR